MSNWTKVKWTEARQIAEAMEIDISLLPDADGDLKSVFDGFRKAGEWQLALDFLGQALPRYDVIGWAAAELNRRAQSTSIAPSERQALDCSLRWLEEPTDAYRRAAQEAAERAPPESPERLLGLAVFMSGGSIAPPELAAVLPPHNVCGRLASAALFVACTRATSPEEAFRAALEAGDTIAAKGFQA